VYSAVNKSTRNEISEDQSNAVYFAIFSDKAMALMVYAKTVE
jgi:hypothetical protein